MISGSHLALANYVARACNINFHPDVKFNTLGWLDSRGLKVAVVYNNYVGHDMHMHIAARPGSLWCHPEVLKHMFTFPFIQLGCKRVTAPIAVQNRRCRDTVESAGFVLEGTCRQLGPHGEDVCIYGMLKTECRWIGEQNGCS